MYNLTSTEKMVLNEEKNELILKVEYAINKKCLIAACLFVMLEEDGEITEKMIEQELTSLICYDGESFMTGEAIERPDDDVKKAEKTVNRLYPNIA